MNTLNKILCKAVDFVFGMAEFIGMSVGLIVKWAILLALGFAAMVAIMFLWLSVPTVLIYAIFGNGPVTSQWQVFAIFGVIAAWTVVCKIAYDHLTKRK